MDLTIKRNIFNAYILLLLTLLFLFFAPVFFNDFGYHNDYEIFTYEKQEYFLEYEWLIIIGRYIGAVLTNFHISFIDTIEDFKYFRFISFLFISSIYLLLISFFKNKTTNPYYLAATLLLCFTTTSFQLDSLWILNFIPTIFNLFIFCLVFILYSFAFSRGINKYAINISTLIALIIGMYIYPPSVFFFIVFLFIDYELVGNDKALKNALVLILLAMPLYYGIHKASLNILVEIPRFENTYKVLMNKPRYDMSFSLFNIDIEKKIKTGLSLIDFSMNLFYGYNVNSLVWKIQSFIKYSIYATFLLYFSLIIFQKNNAKIKGFIYFLGLLGLFVSPFLVSKSDNIFLYRAVGCFQFLILFYFLHSLFFIYKHFNFLKPLFYFVPFLPIIGLLNLNSMVSYAVTEYKSTKNQLFTTLLDNNESSLEVLVGENFDPMNDMLLGAYLNPNFSGFFYGIQKTIGYQKYKKFIFRKDSQEIKNKNLYLDMRFLTQNRQREVKNFIQPSNVGKFYFYYHSGFFYLEDNGVNYWRWTKKQSVFRVINYKEEAVNVELSFDVHSRYKDFSDVEVLLNGKRQHIVGVNSDLQRLKLVFKLAVGDNYIQLNAKDEIKFLSESDKRGIYLYIANLKLQEINKWSRLF